jgi:hypothetical protein
VWVRVHGAGRDERVVIVHVGDRGAVEVARECDTLIWPRRASLKWPHPRSTSP